MILHQYKIVFGGSIGAGKSTAIQTISEIDVISTEAKNTDTSTHQKSHTTVGIDYGEITLDDGVKIGLYGTPGQSRFDFIWPVICQGALGVILLVDHNSKVPLEELEGYLDTFKDYTKNISIGITHVDENKEHTTSIYREWLIQNDYQYPLFFIDARKQEHVLLMIESLIAALEVNLKATN